MNNKYIGDSNIHEYLAFQKKESELGEICLDYITINKDLSLKWHKYMHTFNKHLRLDCGMCFMLFETEVFMYCSQIAYKDNLL